MLNGQGHQKTKVLAVVTLIFMLLLSACAQSSNTSGNTTQTGPVKIGISLSLTGDNSSDGQATLHGYQTWADFINGHGGLLGHQVQLVWYDDGSKTDQTRINYEKLISNDHVNFVVGPFSDDYTITGAEVAMRHNYAFLEGIGTAPGDFKHGLTNLFAVSLPAQAYLTSFVNYILSLPASLRPKTVAYATSDDPFTQPQIDHAKSLLDPGGITSALYEVYPAENADPTGPAQKVVASHADIVLLGTLGAQDCAAFMKTFIQQHFNPKLIIATAGPDQGDAFIKAVGGIKNTEGVLVPNDGWWPQVNSYQNNEFVQLITTKFHLGPADISSDSVQAFSVGQVLQQAVQKAQSLDNGKIMDALRHTTFQSLQGPVQFGSDGQNTASVAFLFQWQKGNLIPVYPQSQAQANVEYPKPAWTS